MGIELQGLRTSSYIVSDITKAKNWYTNILGKAPYFDEPFYVGFNIMGYELGLVPAEDGQVATPGGNTAYWGVNDVNAAFETLISAGATAIENPHDVGGDIVVATVQDPWGNAFGIIYNPHFSLAGAE